MGFHGRAIEADPRLLEQSYRLRYQVYCLERQFLAAADYPDQMERDPYDRHSLHVGAVDDHGELAATARIVPPTAAGLPLFRYCTVFPLVTPVDDDTSRVVEISRVSISRQYARRRDEMPSGRPLISRTDPRASNAAGHDRRQGNGEPFLTLLKAIVYGAKRMAATHLIFAIEPALQRRLGHYGFPLRLAGPEADYYGRVAPYVMSLADLDQVILAGRFPLLEGFPVGGERQFWPMPDDHDGSIPITCAVGPLAERIVR